MFLQKRLLPTLCVLSCFAVPAAYAEEPFEDITFEQAQEKAKKENKVIVIDFYTVWCGPCKMLDKSTWPDPNVQKLLKEKSVALKVDAEKNRPLAQKYRITSYPQILFIRADGTEIDRLVGFQPPEAFIRNAEGPLTGRDKLTIARDSVAKSPNNPDVRMQLADALAQRNMPAEALKEYLWCFDHGPESQPGFLIARNQLVVGKLAALGRSHPPAIAALETRRTEAARRLIAAEAPDKNAPAPAPGGVPDPLQSEAMTIAAIDRALSRPQQTIALYDEIRGKSDLDPAISRALGLQIIDTLWSTRRYDDMLRDGGNVVQRFDEHASRVARADASNPRLIEVVRQQTTTLFAKYSEALLATGRDADAAALSAKLIEFDGRARTYAALIAHASRAGKPDAARNLLEQARKKLPAAELPVVEAAARGIPAASAAASPASPAPAAATP